MAAHLRQTVTRALKGPQNQVLSTLVIKCLIKSSDSGKFVSVAAGCSKNKDGTAQKSASTNNKIEFEQLERLLF